MDFNNYLNSLLEQHNIPHASCIPLSECEVIHKHKLDRCNFSEGDELFVCMMTIPYYTKSPRTNISDYAKSRDYHLFCDMFIGDILQKLRKELPEYKFFGFYDNSPIEEVTAALKAGLGVLGENNLLITEKYSSYVFLCEIITNYPVPVSADMQIKHCHGCGKCRSLCPKEECGVCLSSLTQKKGELTEHEKQSIKKYGYAWGCDICQECCPYTLRSKESGTIYTNIEFFKTHRTDSLSVSELEGMSDEEFSLRAYSWRKRETIMRNLKILEEEEV